MRAAGMPAILTVAEGVITTPGPWGGMGKGVVQACMSAPPAELEIIDPIAAAQAKLRVNEARYPIDRARGNSRKYDEF